MKRDYSIKAMYYMLVIMKLMSVFYMLGLAGTYELSGIDTSTFLVRTVICILILFI